jgi:tetratricopeptide (TPR) repeat protein
VAHGLITVHDGVLRFAGDDFDRIYCKYFARLHDASVRIEAMPPHVLFGLLFGQKLSRVHEVDPIDFVALLGFSNISDVLTDSHQLALELLGNANIRLLPGAYPPQAILMYWTLWEMTHEGGVVTLLNIELSTEWVERSYVFTLSARGTDEFDAIMAELHHVRRRAEELGGTIQFSVTDVPLPGPEEMAKQVADSGNTDLTRIIKRLHGDTLMDAYEDRNIDEALKHAKALSVLDPWRGANSVGYLRLAIGEYYMAKQPLGRAIEVAEPNWQRALSLVNLGMAELMTDSAEAAAVCFHEALAVASTFNHADDEMDLLFSPVLDRDQPHLVELRNASLVQVAQQALEVLDCLSDRAERRED